MNEHFERLLERAEQLMARIESVLPQPMRAVDDNTRSNISRSSALRRSRATTWVNTTWAAVPDTVCTAPSMKPTM